MTSRNEHFTKLINSINKADSNNTNLKQKLNILTDNDLTFRTSRQVSDNISYQSQNTNIFNHLNKIDKDKFVNLNILSDDKLIMSILYSINFNEYNLISNKKEILDDLCNNILIDFNDIFKNKDYRNISQKKKIRKIVEDKQINNDLFLMIMADYLDINLVILNSRIIKFINNIENRATILIYKDKDEVHTLDSIQEFTLVDLLKKTYSKLYKNFLAIRLKTISNYKLTDLQQICHDYGIVINPNKKLKKDLYNILVKFFEF